MAKEISKTWQPKEAEQKWYKYWLEKGFFKSKPNPEKEPYTIVIPPPNVTGVLHMGHILNNTIQDTLIRKARMEGKEALWVPGTDHASIATEAKVVAMLKEQGIDKKSIGREEFLKHAWIWKEKYGGIIIEQLKAMGASCDWDRTRFTMEPSLSRAVIDVFVDLYNKGLIYRGIRMVNWDPLGLTAVSDEEVIHKEVQSKLYYINYPFAEGEGFLTIATTRPETIFADVAICVNPSDERYLHLIGKQVLIPILGKAIPVIADSYVDPAFGTGCLKVTPAHDINDYQLGITHKLPVIDLLNDNGTLNENGHQYQGMDRFAVRKQIVIDLKENGFIQKEEDIKNNVGYSERTNAVIEPKLSLQWFLKMKDLAEPALKAVMDDEIKLHPPKFKNMYKAWMEQVHDWCISRQLWWGHRIPAYYLPTGEIIVANSEEEALMKAQAINPSISLADLKQDEDVLDTWFSSWLWPISVFDGFDNPDNEDIKYYYPTNDLVTAPEILFFWVARMIMAGYEYKGAMPFKNVYLTGIVRDKQGRKMSKSLGNSPDPLDLMALYGADGVRAGMLFSSPAGNDLPFDDKLVEQGRNFSNKIWNAFRLLQGLEEKVDANIAQPQEAQLAVEWFKAKLSATIIEVNDLFDKFRISDALLAIYNLIWDDFCSWYLEMIKPSAEQNIDAETLAISKNYLEQLMQLLHPIMPFITEEIYQNLEERAELDSICVSSWPKAANDYKQHLMQEAKLCFGIISEIRKFRSSKGMSPKLALDLIIDTEEKAIFERWQGVISKLANLDTLQFAAKADDALKGHSFLADTVKCTIPYIAEEGISEADTEAIIKEIAYFKGFLEQVYKKLHNEKFMANAKPEVIAVERKKEQDTLAKIAALEQQL